MSKDCPVCLFVYKEVPWLPKAVRHFVNPIPADPEDNYAYYEITCSHCGIVRMIPEEDWEN
jgi:hypothetical protein